MANEKSWAASAASRRKQAEERFWSVVQNLYGDRLTYERFEYLGATTFSTATCVLHGDFKTKPTYLVNGNGCPKCGREKVKQHAKSRRLGLSGFIKKARAVHGEAYSYPEQPYANNKGKVRIVCPVHGEFLQKANGHLSGRGCPECANDLKRERNYAIRDGLAETKIAQLVAAFPEYDFSKAVYAGNSKKIEVRCATHGVFYPTPANMLTNGTGCPGCGLDKVRQAADSKRLTTEQWVAAARAVHGDKYSYGKSHYVGDKQPITVTCSVHGDFVTRTDGHVRDQNGCPRCAHHLSKAEDTLARFLSIFTKVEQRNRTILKPKELDIYLPEHALAVEYCGMHWHSHKDREDERKNKLRHYEKFKACAEQGIRLITIYETDWKENPRAIKRLLRNAIGKSKGRLMARKCELRKVTNKEAAVFYDRYHPQGGSGHGEHYALFWKGKMVACMRFVLGANDRGAGAANRVWTLGRYATRVNVAGAASRLFKAFVAEHNPPEVKSFSDNRLFGGGMYEKLGFVLEENVAPDYQVWSQKLGLRPKPHYQRRQLQKRLREHGFDETYDHLTDTRTEAEMTYYMGARRIYDCGKKRWLWTPQ